MNLWCFKNREKGKLLKLVGLCSVVLVAYSGQFNLKNKFLAFYEKNIQLQN